MSTFTTESLKKLVSYAIQGAGLNDKIELSKYIGIRISDGVLYLNTTDGENFLSVSDTCVADDMDITLDADTFSKLIGKINSDTVDLERVDNTLVVKGNGKYTLELITDDAGNTLSFPDRFPELSETLGNISAEDLLAINTTIKASLSTVVGSTYSSYYFGSVVASTDRVMMSIFNRSVFDEPYMLNRQFVDLMCLGNSSVVLSKSENTLVSEAQITDSCTISVCTRLTNNTSDFRLDVIQKFNALTTDSFCRFKRADMLSLLDRLSLFVSRFDDGAIELHFTDKYVEVSSLKSNGVERVDYTESKDIQDITIKINIDRFRNQLKAYSSDIVDLYYGSDVCIKLIDGDMTQIIALIK